MAFDDALHRRVRAALRGHPALSERKMFGGVCFTVQGNMCCGILGSELIVRVGPDAFADSMRSPHARVFDFSGRPMTGWLYVASAGIAIDADLSAWIRRGVGFASSLPPK